MEISDTILPVEHLVKCFTCVEKQEFKAEIDIFPMKHEST